MWWVWFISLHFFLPLNRFSNLQQVAHRFELLLNTEAQFYHLLTFLSANLIQRSATTIDFSLCIKCWSVSVKTASLIECRNRLKVNSNMSGNLFLWWGLDFRYWYNRHHALPTSQSFSDSIIQAVHCQVRRYPECNCQLFSLWIKPKENSRPRSAQTGFSPRADRPISIYEDMKQKTLSVVNEIARLIIPPSCGVSSHSQKFMKAPIYSSNCWVFVANLSICVCARSSWGGLSHMSSCPVIKCELDRLLRGISSCPKGMFGI